MHPSKISISNSMFKMGLLISIISRLLLLLLLLGLFVVISMHIRGGGVACVLSKRIRGGECMLYVWVCIMMNQRCCGSCKYIFLPFNLDFAH